MFHNYTLNVIDDVCKYNPIFDIYYDAPIVDSEYDILSNDLILFIS